MVLDIMPHHISLKYLNCFSNSKLHDPKQSAITSHIDPAVQSTAKVKALEIGKQLDTGTVIIGESHDNSNARAIIEELVHNNKVKDLFLESPDLSCDTFGGRGNETLSQHINQLSKKQLESDEPFKFFSKVMKGPAINGSQLNSIPIPDLILAAREGNVKVHLIDNVVPGSKSIVARSQERNQGMGEEFCKASNYSKPGGAILVGIDHCAPGNNSLQARCHISDHFVHNLSSPTLMTQ